MARGGEGGGVVCTLAEGHGRRSAPLFELVHERDDPFCMREVRDGFHRVLGLRGSQPRTWTTHTLGAT